MRSFPSVELRKHRHKKRKHHHRRHRKHAAKPVEQRGQSWFGTLSLFFGLIALFVLTVQGIVWFQAEHGAKGAMRLIITWVARIELLTAILGLFLALLSFPFSSGRQRNAVFGFLLSVGVLAAWIWLANWKPLW